MPVQTTNMSKYEGVLFSEGSKFASYYAKIKKHVSGDKLKQFVVKNTEDQIKFLLDVPDIHEVKAEVSGSIKNLEKALEFKEQGNDFFRQRNYGEAFKFYTKAIQHCPVDESKPEDPANKDFSIMFANRSAAMDGAGLYAACIHDIDTSLKFGYPRELWYKIYKRKGHAAIKMRQYLVAKEALEIALKNVGKSDIKKEKDRDNYRMRIRKQMTVFNVTKSLYNCELHERASTALAGMDSVSYGISPKLRIAEDGNKRVLEVVGDQVDPEDVIIALDPYVAVVNVSGGRAGGKICPFTLEKMFKPIPCSFGSEQLFGSFESRDEANKIYHKNEWSILKSLDEVQLMERSRLALRMITKVDPENIMKLAASVNCKNDVDESVKVAVNTLKLNTDKATDEDRLVAGLISLFLVRCLSSSGYVRSTSNDPSSISLTSEQTELYKLLQMAVLVAIYHTQPITLFDVPKDKKGMLGEDVKIDTCGFGIYPDLDEIEEAGSGPESHVIRWFAEKKMVITSFRKLEKGQPVCIVENPNLKTKPSANDMITFRCANEICSCSFPLKENTKEKIISCPLDDCGLKTNIWERLKLIQRLKKDFTGAKEEFNKSDVALAKDVLRSTIDEWDRIIVRPYRDIDQLQALFVNCLSCMIGDDDRKLVEGNQFGHLLSKKHKVNVLPEDNTEEPTTSRIIEVK